jgi:hypothetical protein
MRVDRFRATHPGASRTAQHANAALDRWGRSPRLSHRLKEIH